jgi:hypothetical protein
MCPAWQAARNVQTELQRLGAIISMVLAATDIVTSAPLEDADIFRFAGFMDIDADESCLKAAMGFLAGGGSREDDGKTRNGKETCR